VGFVAGGGDGSAGFDAVAAGGLALFFCSHVAGLLCITAGRVWGCGGVELVCFVWVRGGGSLVTGETKIAGWHCARIRSTFTGTDRVIILSGCRNSRISRWARLLRRRPGKISPGCIGFSSTRCCNAAATFCRNCYISDRRLKVDFRVRDLGKGQGRGLGLRRTRWRS
jgi:hypothetical protein